MSSIFRVRGKDGTIIEVPAIKGDRGPQGIKGDAGEKGDKGSDASVTTENITNALGYTPVSPTELDEKQPKNFIVTISGTPPDNLTADKTFDEINEAMENGKNVFCNFAGSYLPFVVSTLGFVFCVSVYGIASEDDTMIIEIIVMPDNSVRYVTGDFSPSTKQDTLIAGDGIVIAEDGKTISATTSIDDETIVSQLCTTGLACSLGVGDNTLYTDENGKVYIL